MASAKRTTSERRKIALIVFNDQYTKPQNTLPDSSQKARQLRDSLQKIGFEVEQYRNVETEIINVIIPFNAKVRNGDLVFFYFFGHAYQIDGKNYLVPTNDRKIVSSLDVKDLCMDAERLIQRMLSERSSCTTIVAFDCCRPYLLKEGSTSSGLQLMSPPSGTFIQFSAGKNEIAPNDLFNQELTKQIGEENVDVRDLFRRISDNVYQNSNRRQRPFSMDGLPKGQPIYMNEVYRPPECPMTDINPNELKEVKKQFAEMREHFENFSDIEAITNDNDPNIRRAQTFTNDIIRQKPSGKVADRSTACHVMYQLLGGERTQCLFYDSKQGMSLPMDASTNLVGLSNEDRPLMVRLKDSRGLGSEDYARVDQHELKLAYTLDVALANKQSHPVMDDVRERLAKAHGVHKNQIIFQSFFEGSHAFVYTVLDLANNTLRKIENLSGKLRCQFKQFLVAKIHPLLFRPSFDISFFDEHGNKTFQGDSSSFDIGPPGRTQKYVQPNGWTRYGLKVLGRYSNDTWLDPFRDTRNWYRAFHGTGRATNADFKGSEVNFDQQFAPVDAAGNIFEKGFLPARVAAHGAGVYCSPNPKFPENGYVNKVYLDTKEGRKAFKCMLQVAVNPDGVVFTKVKDIWLVPKPEDIRTYGILIKDDD